jgi:hypothetical protein
MLPADVHASFISLAPQGSIGGAKKQLRKWLSDVHNAHKRLWFDSTPMDDILAPIDGPAMQFSQAQTKTEAALKLRTIMPGETPHWGVETVVTQHVEPAIFRALPELSLGLNAVGRFAHHLGRLRRIAKRRWTVASDYANFNWLHLFPDMGRFWRTAVRDAAITADKTGAWRGRSYLQYIHDAAEWLASSLHHTYVRPASGEGRWIHVLRGLLSGWRTTTLINNVQNYTYSDATSTALTPLLGCQPITYKQLNGDDSDMVAASLFCGLIFLRSLSLSRLDVQAAKQLVSDQNAEFLRIWYSDTGIHGSLARATASFVSSDLQAPIIDAGPEFARGTSTALNLLIRRGADANTVEALRSTILLHYAVVKYQDESGSDILVQLTNRDMLYTPTNLGGWGCVRYNTFTTPRPSTSRPWPTGRYLWSLSNAPHHASRAMLAKVYGNLHNAGITSDSYGRLWADIVSAATYGVDTKTASPEMNYIRSLVADHIRWQNAVTMAAKPTPAPMLDSRLHAAIEAEMAHVLSLDISAALQITALDPGEAFQEAIARALGLGAVSPGLLNTLRDQRTGLKLSLIEVQRRLGTKSAHTAALHTAWPLRLISAIENGHLQWTPAFADTIPSDFLPLTTHLQSFTLKRLPTDMLSMLNNPGELALLMAGINTTIAQTFVARYRHTYAF